MGAIYPPKTSPGEVLDSRLAERGAYLPGRKTNTAEQMVNKLREAETLLGQGKTVSEASRKIGVMD